jgi:hypothetical protein
MDREELRPITMDKLIRAETKILDEDEGLVEATVSTEAPDRDGDVIRQEYWQIENFKAHPVLLSSHDYTDLRSQIGEWQSMDIKGKTLVGVAKYYINEGNEQADWGFNLATKKRAAFSVGFMPDWNRASELENGAGGKSVFPNYEFKGQELLEVSHVIVPANPEALQRMKGVQLPATILALVNEILSEETEGSTESDISVKEMSHAIAHQVSSDIIAYLKDMRVVQEQQSESRQQEAAENIEPVDVNKIIRDAIQEVL